MAKLLGANTEEFRKAAQAARGRVLVLVHPFYQHRDERYDALISQLEKLKVPLVVLEEQERIPFSARQLPANAFFVGTEERNPEPVKGWDSLHALLKAAKAKTVLLGGIQAMNDRAGPPEYQDAQVEPALRERIKRYERRQIARPRIRITKGCVGEAYARFLGGRFRVRLVPGLLYPHRPHEISPNARKLTKAI